MDTKQLIQSSLQTLTIMCTALIGHTPDIATLTGGSSNIFVSVNANAAFHKLFMEYVTNCKVKIFRELICSELLGRAISLGFQNIRQTVFKRNTVVSQTIEEYYISFLKQVALYPKDQMYPINLAQQV